MSTPVNRTAVIITLAVFLCFSVFCISTLAPVMQEDILDRSRDALMARRIPLRGLSVDGRDVLLSGTPDSAITSARARKALEEVPGVRTVKIKLLPSRQSMEGVPRDWESGAETSSGVPQAEIQAQIDRALEEQPVKFGEDAAVLKPGSEVALDKVASYLTGAPELLCEIRGYAIQSREARQNWVLALQRALATEDYLVGKGVPEWRLSTRAIQIGEGTAGRKTDRVIDLVVRTAK